MSHLDEDNEKKKKEKKDIAGRLVYVNFKKV